MSNLVLTPSRSLAAADLLKLRRRRGLVAVTALLTVGAMKHVLHSRSRLRPPLLRNSAPGAGCYMGKTFSDGLNSQPITVFACPI
jgi:hypothetical protein